MEFSETWAGAIQCTNEAIAVNLGFIAFATLMQSDHIGFEKFALWNNMEVILKTMTHKYLCYNVKLKSKTEMHESSKKMVKSVGQEI